MDYLNIAMFHSARQQHYQDQQLNLLRAVIVHAIVKSDSENKVLHMKIAPS